MIIGIDASRAFLEKRTGIEEYAYQVIKHLREMIPETDYVILYVRKNLKLSQPDFNLPPNWEIRPVSFIGLSRFWTQAALSWEMLWRCPDVLFVPAHTAPFIHPKKTIVTVHGLEYEFCRNGYSFWARLYMRFFIRFSCRAASLIICVSENTKKDVMRLYKIPEEKIEVVYEGYSNNFQFPISKLLPTTKPYLLFIGRLEERKNIGKIIEAFEILKEKCRIPHQLILAGKPGYGYRRIRYQVLSIKYKAEVIELGYVTENEKWELLENAAVFLFPTLYEGFGLPILEAQAAGTPVVASDNSSIPEIVESVGHDESPSALLVDPRNARQIAEAAYKLISDKNLRDDIIKRGFANVKRFSWEKCAKEIAEVLRK